MLRSGYTVRSHPQGGSADVLPSASVSAPALSIAWITARLSSEVAKVGAVPLGVGGGKLAADSDGLLDSKQRLARVPQLRHGCSQVFQGRGEVRAVPLGVGCSEFAADGDGFLGGYLRLVRVVRFQQRCAEVVQRGCCSLDAHNRFRSKCSAEIGRASCRERV